MIIAHHHSIARAIGWNGVYFTLRASFHVPGTAQTACADRVIVRAVPGTLCPESELHPVECDFLRVYFVSEKRTLHSFFCLLSHSAFLMYVI
jgi:hypothetical protein